MLYVCLGSSECYVETTDGMFFRSNLTFCESRLLYPWSTEESFFVSSALGSTYHNLDYPSRDTASAHRARVSSISITGKEPRTSRVELPVITTCLRRVLFVPRNDSLHAACIIDRRWHATCSQPELRSVPGLAGVRTEAREPVDSTFGMQARPQRGGGTRRPDGRVLVATPWEHGQRLAGLIACSLYRTPCHQENATPQQTGRVRIGLRVALTATS